MPLLERRQPPSRLRVDGIGCSSNSKPPRVESAIVLEQVMLYVDYAPSPALRPFVDRLWTLDGPQGAGELAPILPDGHPELIVHCGDPFVEVREGGERLVQAPILVAGQLRQAVRIAPLGHTHVVGVRLRPDGAAAIFGGSLDELTGRIVDCAAIDRVLARRLHDHVVPQRSAIERVRALDRVLRNHVAPPRADRLVAEACTIGVVRRGLVRVGDVADTVGLSVRQLERRFVARVGLPPKLFLRVIRFQEVLRAIGPARADDWAGLAVDHGFYDQSHFVADFKAFTGHSPSAWGVSEDSLTAVFSAVRRRSSAKTDVAFLQDPGRIGE
jgi:AraC-like DNA-binding protein